ncbi:MAG: 3-dehydroquinate synthase [Tissierellia bacterium]|nr:3-dehydroquinate synthase [Tissierellia bacterium]
MDIIIGENCIGKLNEYLRSNRATELYIITDDNVNALHMEKLKEVIKGYDMNTYTLSPGEESKSISTILSIYDDLIENNIDRDAIILSFGGGVVGDIAGFAASTYKRGLKYIQIPTTLLAQVDSSVGGKVGIDYGGYKNIVGSFYFPELTLVDIQFLDTLKDREIICGLGEVLKYGLIYDYDLFQFTMDNMEQIYNKDLDILLQIIRRSITIKEEVVNRDRYDTGLRMILNFGHTIGHGIEAYYDFGRYNHGEAIILGMIYESKIAYRMGLIDEKYFQTIYQGLRKLVAPVKFNGYEIEQLIHRMKNDKKNKGDRIAFILPISRGKVKLHMDVDEGLIAESLKGEWV